MRKTQMYRDCPDPPRLTKHDIQTLNRGAYHRDGVIKPEKTSNWDRTDKRMEKLVKLGYATPNPHGDWYITDAGRAVLQRGRDHIAALADADGEATFAGEVRAGAWDHRSDVEAAIIRLQF